MADFALWATACETRYWTRGRFMAAYERSRLGAIDDVLEADPVASAIRRLMSGQREWAGNATELMHALGRVTDAPTRSSHVWPATPALLSNRLRRAASFLRRIGIEVEARREGHTRTRVLRLSNHASTAVDEGPTARPREQS